jgi:hypothetical protein
MPDNKFLVGVAYGSAWAGWAHTLSPALPRPTLAQPVRLA